MQLMHDARSRSLSAAGLYDSNRYLGVPELGDDHTDSLTLDIKGREYEVVPTLHLQALGVRVFATSWITWAPCERRAR
jgi:hypothetical protein